MGLSDRLRTVVCDLDISQTKFADTLGVSFTYINCLINGKRENLSQSLAILIQQLYGYSAQWLLYEEGNVLKKNNPPDFENKAAIDNGIKHIHQRRNRYGFGSYRIHYQRNRKKHYR
ncbi:MAG: helix-turn-helix domain-containing protein [Treponema sp.]|jgi:plasmid maintenance system antidote protein VapI|nr:helix-turn-helix domain-containing protein [Treponema sp.]